MSLAGSTSSSRSKPWALRPSYPVTARFGDASTIVGQRAYFIALREAVRKIIAHGGDAAIVRTGVPRTRKTLVAHPQIARSLKAAFPDQQQAGWVDFSAARLYDTPH
jgi:hypothetical protein